MPFTPAHAAAALPFAKWRGVSFAAVVIGTMVPDLPLFVRAGPSYATLHAPMTAVPIGIPLGIVLLVLFEWTKGSLVAFLPEKLQRRIGSRAQPAMPLGVRGWSAALVGLAVGIPTHVVWDAFTHRGAWGIVLVPALAQPWLHLGPWQLHGYKLMQYASTVFGLAVIGERVWRWVQRLPPGSSARIAIMPVSVRASAVACLFVVAPMVSLVHAFDVATRAGDDFLVICAYEFVTRAIAGGLVIALVFSAAHRTWQWSHRPRCQ